MFEAEKLLLEKGQLYLSTSGKGLGQKDYVTGLVRNFIGADPDFIYADVEGKTNFSFIMGMCESTYLHL